MKHTIQFSMLLALSLLLNGCTSPPKNEIPLVKGGLHIRPMNTNETKLVIFNKASIVSVPVLEDPPINVMLNGKGVAKIDQGQYVQIIVPKGKYQLHLEHWDLVNWSSQHEFEFVDSESFLIITSTMFSNSAGLISALPLDFEEKYKPVE